MEWPNERIVGGRGLCRVRVDTGRRLGGRIHEIRGSECCRVRLGAGRRLGGRIQ